MSAPATAIVLLAAGSGRRVGAEQNKVLLHLDGVPLLAHSVRTALELDHVHRIVVVIRPEDRTEVAQALVPHLGAHDVWLVEGGAERHDSEARAIDALREEINAGEITIVAIHDAARPRASAELFRTVIATAAECGAAVPVLPAGALSNLDGSVAGSGLVTVQTPQAFRADVLAAAYSAAAQDSFTGTDTAATLERYADLKIRSVPGEHANLKVTFPEDLALVHELARPGND